MIAGTTNRRLRGGRTSIASVVLVAFALLATSCAPRTASGAGDERLRVVTTTGILADLARNVAGDRPEVVSLVPDNADPHAYEPSLRDIRDVVYADVAFSNYLLLEQHAIIRTLDANLPDDVPNVSLAEAAVKYAARIIPLVENAGLDTIWLGLRVDGTGKQHGATRASQVRLVATGMDGPGQLTGYLTETFGSPRIYFDSADGLDPTGGADDDAVRLPTDAHTHMSWTFAEPGVYRLDLAAALQTDDGELEPMGADTITFAVGVDPHSIPGMSQAAVLDHGHADITVDLDDQSIHLVADEHDDGHHAHVHELDPADTVVAVPNSALAPIPASPDFRFLGRPAEDIFQLPQAVLGAHVHGEIDPHLWHDVRNAVAYVQIMRDTLIDADPDGAATYRANAKRYIDQLHELDQQMADTIARIPESRRHLVTTHDAFGYLAAAYDLDIAGFVTPNPATEPSLADRRRLSETIRNLQVPAVFVEPNLISRGDVLNEIAAQHDVAVCPIHGDTLTAEVTTYIDLMRANARSLHRCLTAPDPEATP